MHMVLAGAYAALFVIRLSVYIQCVKRDKKRFDAWDITVIVVCAFMAVVLSALVIMAPSL